MRAELGIEVALPSLNGSQRQRRMLDAGMSLTRSTRRCRPRPGRPILECWKLRGGDGVSTGTTERRSPPPANRRGAAGRLRGGDQEDPGRADPARAGRLADQPGDAPHAAWRPAPRTSATPSRSGWRSKSSGRCCRLIEQTSPDAGGPDPRRAVAAPAGLRQARRRAAPAPGANRRGRTGPGPAPSRPPTGRPRGRPARPQPPGSPSSPSGPSPASRGRRSAAAGSGCRASRAAAARSVRALAAGQDRPTHRNRRASPVDATSAGRHARLAPGLCRGPPHHARRPFLTL